MSDIVIEDLFITAAEDASAENLGKLFEALKQAEKLDDDEITGQLELVFEEFGEGITEAQADFCLNLARLDIKDHSVFRKVLTDAIKKKLPPYLNKLGFLRALGLRDRDVTLQEIVTRYENMLTLKNNMLVFFKSSKRWGRVSDIDAVSASVAVASINGGAFAVPLAITLHEGKIFEAGTTTPKLARFLKNNFSGADYRALAAEKSVKPLSDAEIKEIAYATAVPDIMHADEFKSWWTSGGNTAAKQNHKGRQFFEARSVQELHVLLNKSLEPLEKLDDAGTEKLVEFFSNLNPAAAARNIDVLSESISMLVERGDDEQLRRIFQPLITKVPFWPASLDMIQLEALNILGSIPAKHIGNIAYAMNLIFPAEYLAAYATCLPLRCLNTFGEIIDDDLLYDAIKSLHMCSCDILLWIWRNRKKHDEELLELISIEQVSKALTADKLPKAWTGAQRDLKKTIDQQ